MPTVNLWTSKGFADAVDKAAGVKPGSHFSFPDNWEVGAEAEVDAKILKKLQDDPRLHQVVRDACKPEYEKLIKLFAGALQDLNNGLANGKISLEDADEAFKHTFGEKVLAPNVDKCVKSMSIAAGAAMQEYCKNIDDYKKYKFVVSVKIGVCVAGVIVSVALIASSPFDAGAGAIIGIITLGLSCIKLASLIHDTSRDTVDELKKVHHIFRKLDKDLEKKHSSAKNFTKEIANEFSSTIIGIKAFSATVKNAHEHLDKAELKLKSYDVLLSKLSKKLEKSLRKLDDLSKLEEKRKAIPKEVRPKGDVVKAKIQKLQARVAAILTKTDKANDLKKYLTAVLKEANQHMEVIDKNMASTKKEVMDLAVEATSKLLILTDTVVAIGTADVASLGFALTDLGLQLGDYVVGEYLTAENKKLSEAFLISETSGLVDK